MDKNAARCRRALQLMSPKAVTIESLEDQIIKYINQTIPPSNIPESYINFFLFARS